MYARALAADGVVLAPGVLDGALASVWAEVHAEPTHDRYGGVTGERNFWRGFLHRVRGRLDGRTVSEECFDRISSHFREPGSWAVYPDVAPTLDALEARGIALGVVSNWDSSLPALLGSLGLARRFATIAVSAIEATGKPDPEIFRRACGRLALPPERCLHVGDSRRDDVEGARAAGIRGVLLDRDGVHPDVPDRIRSLEQILGLDGFA